MVAYLSSSAATEVLGNWMKAKGAASNDLSAVPHLAALNTEVQDSRVFDHPYCRSLQNLTRNLGPIASLHVILHALCHLLLKISLHPKP